MHKVRKLLALTTLIVSVSGVAAYADDGHGRAYGHYKHWDKHWDKDWGKGRDWQHVYHQAPVVVYRTYGPPVYYSYYAPPPPPPPRVRLYSGSGFGFWFFD